MGLWIANLNNQPKVRAPSITNEGYSKKYKYLTSDLNLLLQKCCTHPSFEGKAKAATNTHGFKTKPIVYRALCPIQAQGISLSSVGEAQRHKHKLWQLREREQLQEL